MSEHSKILYKLVKILYDPPASIEILPGDVADWMSPCIIPLESPPSPTTESPFIYYQGHLGIPQKALYALYIHAVSIFEMSTSTPDLREVSSSIILLANPAHQSALNSRKLLIQEGQILPQKELDLTRALVSASGDFAKQSIIWDHRRWLFRQLYPPVTHTAAPMPNHSKNWPSLQGLENLPQVPAEVVKDEFNIIRRACEIYSRNYHAWSHWHFMVDAIYVRLHMNGDHRHYLDVLADEFVTLHRWFTQHISDHSAMHHLCNLCHLFNDLECRYPSSLIKQFLEIPSLNSFLADHALNLTMSYPSHESLWLYLRRIVSLLPIEERNALTRNMKSSPVSRSLMGSRFIAWVTSYETTLCL